VNATTRPARRALRRQRAVSIHAVCCRLARRPDDLTTLRHWASVTQAPAVLVRRAKLLLLAAEGASNTEIAQRLGVSWPTVLAWRKRYAREGLTGRLADRHRRAALRPCAVHGAPRSWPPPWPHRPSTWV
jgi:ATP/maltotriose-dependent transcriptional regulator MalT